MKKATTKALPLVLAWMYFGKRDFKAHGKEIADQIKAMLTLGDKVVLFPWRLR